MSTSAVRANTAAGARAESHDDGSVRLGYEVRKLTVLEVLAAQAARIPEKTFIRYLPDGREFTFAQTFDASRRLANGLRSLGIARGTHVAVMMENSPELLLAHFALGILGGVTVPLNIATRGKQLAYMLSQSDAQVLIIDRELVERFTEIEAELPNLRAVIVAPHRAGDEINSAGGKALHDLTALLDFPAELACETAAFTDLAYILYTSGTTGPSKGVMLTQARNLLWGIGHVEAYGHRPDDIFYVCLPLFHVNALQGSTYLALTLGATVALQKRFSASRFWPDIHANRATITNLMSSMVNILWSRPPGPHDRSGIRMCLCGPIPNFAAAFQARFGLRFIAAFSMTDFGASHRMTLDDPPEKILSLGRPRRGFEARIVDEHDFPVPVGQPGELVLRCSLPWNVSSGYYKLDDVTVRANRNGWFHTGDIARIDEDGYLWFVGRQKDAVRRRGENISAYEVEQIILTHPSIEDAAVFPRASEMAEEEVAVAAVLIPGATLSETELIEFCAQNMAAYMVPRFVRFMPDLPRNASQKVEKYKLRAEAEGNPSLYWDRGVTPPRRSAQSPGGC